MNAEPSQSQYVVTCLYGLEALLAAEVQDRLGVPSGHQWCEVTFSYDGPCVRLTELRTAGNVFLLFDSFPVGHTVPDLAVLEAGLRRLPVDLWRRRWEEFSGQALPHEAVCVTVDRKGEHNYTYREVEELALRVLPEVTGMKATLDPCPLELRVEIHEQQCRLTGRLTAAPLSMRPYKRFHFDGETDPTLAAAMVRASAPAESDVFLDPFCGCGTVAIERALAGPAAQIVAGDVKLKRVTWAMANSAAAGAQVSFAQWDARALPFPDRMFTRIVTNPPQSNPDTGKPWQRAELLDLVGDCLRVLEFGGLAVWLLQQERPFQDVFKKLGAFRTRKSILCNWKGKRWTVRVVEKVL